MICEATFTHNATSCSVGLDRPVLLTMSDLSTQTRVVSAMNRGYVHPPGVERMERYPWAKEQTMNIRQSGLFRELILSGLLEK